MEKEEACNGFLGLQDAKTRCDKGIIIESQKFSQYTVLSFFVKNKGSHFCGFFVHIFPFAQIMGLASNLLNLSIRSVDIRVI